MFCDELWGDVIRCGVMRFLVLVVGVGVGGVTCWWW